MNNKFKINDNVICTFGSNKGKVFKVVEVLKDSYSCILEGSKDNKYYSYNDNTLISKALTS